MVSGRTTWQHAAHDDDSFNLFGAVGRAVEEPWRVAYDTPAERKSAPKARKRSSVSLVY
jgi:hypothetical protein